MTWTLRAASITLAAWLATAASPCAGTPSAPSQASPEPARVRMALVGAWHVHTGGFLNRISQMNAGQVEWVAVWDRDAVRGKQFADRLGVPYEPEYQRILDNPAVDAVMIEAETNLHADLIIRAARAGKHVFTDKILTPRVDDALRIKDAIERSGVKFVISHESMPVGSYQYARKLVLDGSLGEIVSVHFRRAHGMAKGSGLPASWWDPAVAGGGALIDLGVHGMGLLTYLAGAPVRMSASMRHRTKRAVEDTATIMVDFESGAIGTAHTDMVTNIQENLLEVVGTDGCLVVVGTEGRETVYLNSRHIPERAKGMTVVTPSEYASDGKYPINKFIDFVRDRSNTAQYLDGTGLDMETALRIVAISEAAYESARNGGRPQAVRAGATAAPPEGFLRADGTRIVDGQGREVLLRGMGLGGWMLQEGYMLGVKKDGTQHSIKARIADLVGKEDTEEFYRLWRQNHMARADVDRLAASGFNSIRLPMHYNLFTLPIEEEPVKGRDTWLRTGFEMTDNLLAWCRANRMYLILDLHAAPGGQGKDANISDYDPARPSLWESEENRRKTVALWRKLAERYANDPWLGGYDILNEPNWTFEGKDKNGREDVSNQPIWDIYKAITRAIREVDTKHLVIVEGNGWGNNYSGLPEPWDSNLAMSFHKYWNPNTEQEIARFLALREKHHLPIWLGESGENTNEWFRECVALVERHGIGWAWWPYKKLSNPRCIQTVTPPDDFKKVVDYWNGEGERPSREAARRGLFELVENLKTANCRFNADVAQALIPAGIAGAAITQAPVTPAGLLTEDKFLGIATYRLWEGGAPGALGRADADVPTVTIFRPQPRTGNGTAIILAPGGAYLGLAANLEGRQVADYFTARGVTAFVLKYRLGKDYLYPTPLLDAQRAIRLVRSRAQEFGIAPDRIGMMGFSAGGHLTATAGTMFDDGKASASDPVERVSSRPDFLVLGYPWLNAMKKDQKGVISYCSVLKIEPEKCSSFEQYSPDLHAGAQTPPTFIYHTTDDELVPVEASVGFYRVVAAAGVPVEMHLFAKGKHGSGLGLGDAALDNWPVLLEAWLRGRGLLAPAPAAAGR